MKSWEPPNIQELERGIGAGNQDCIQLQELQLESWGTHVEDEVQVYIFHYESCLPFEPTYLLILNRSKTVRRLKKKFCTKVKKQQLELDMEQQTVPNWERNTSRLYIANLLI